MRRPGRSDDNVRATIEQVAALATVSTATASRALNHPHAVSDALRERVGAAVAQLGYIPNQTARALSSLHSRLIGVLVPAIDASHVSVVDAIQRRLGQTGYAMLLASSGEDGGRVVEEGRRMAAREIEGLALVGMDVSKPLRVLLDERRIPFVVVDAKPGASASAGVVEGDYRAAGETVARYLLGLGHRALAFLGSGGQGSPKSAALLAGVHAALAGQENIRSSDASLVLPSSRAELHQCLAAAAGPTALICADDLLALMALRACAALGITVPKRVSIVGCGDCPFAQHTTPTLSTLRIPGEAIGRAVVDQLLGPSRGLPVVQAIPIKLVVRQSSGPAPT